MNFPAAFLDDIRARVPISSVIGRRVSWDRRKSNPSKSDFWACCPFHNEKTPSFHADDRKGIYYCFGCKASGDVFTFLTQKDGLSFAEAVRKLADEAGLQVPTLSPEEAKREEKRASLYDVMEAAARFFETQLYSSRGAEARDYLTKRGLVGEILHEFRLGYAPDSRSALREHLSAKGIALEQMIESGLLVAGDDIPVAYDRFRDRIMFPIHDLRGQVIAFGGRALSKDAQAKYLNSPETPLFRKGTILYNMDRARRPAHESQELFVVEGYTDVIALHRSGTPNAVAPLGTALTDDHLTLLWRTVPAPVLCFDGDEAGRRAAARVQDLAVQRLKPGYSLDFVAFPEGLDPDDIVRASGRSALRAQLNDRISLVDALWQRIGFGLKARDPDDRARVEAQIEEQVRQIADPIVSRHYRTALRTRFWETLKANGRWNGDRSERPQPRTTITDVKSKFRDIPNFPEWELVCLVALFPSVINQFDSQLGALDLHDKSAKGVLSAILSWASQFPQEIEISGTEKILELIVRTNCSPKFRYVFSILNNKIFSNKATEDHLYIQESFIEKINLINHRNDMAASRQAVLEAFEAGDDEKFVNLLNDTAQKKNIHFGSDDYLFFEIAADVMRRREKISENESRRMQAAA
jgi:DNA primase catalytic core